MNGEELSHGDHVVRYVRPGGMREGRPRPASRCRRMTAGTKEDGILRKVSCSVAEEDIKAKTVREIHHSYLSRIEFLREEAVAEGIIFNKDSERDFRMFIESVPVVQRGWLFLMDNGDLRAVWDDDKDNLLGIQFLGNSLARYVVFRRRAEDGSISRVAGTDTLKGVSARIEAFQLGNLLSL